MSAVTKNAMPTLSQLRGWESGHLSSAAERWQSAADTWNGEYGEVAAGVGSPGGTEWEGAASTTARNRVAKDKAGVQAVAERLELAARVSGNGAEVVALARQRALHTVDAANSLGFDVTEDLSVVDRVPSWPFPLDEVRRRQADLLAVDVKTGAAQLAAIDQQLAADMNTVTAGFDSLDFKQEPVIEPLDTEQNPSFGQCWSEDFKDDIGEGMIRGALTGAISGAIRGGIVGVLGGPLGVLGGVVVGGVGGAAGGVLITGPLLTAGTSVWDCL